MIQDNMRKQTKCSMNYVMTNKVNKIAKIPLINIYEFSQESSIYKQYHHFPIIGIMTFF